MSVRVVPVAVARAEDGHGHVVAAVDPVAIDLVTSSGWPGLGRATTLTVGDLEFHDAGYPTVTTMRYVLADRATLPTDAEVALEGGGPAARRVLAHALPAAR